MKKFYTCVVALLLCFFFCTQAYAFDSSKTSPENLYVVNQITADEDFIDYVNICFEDIDNFRIIDESGNDVTIEILPLLQVKYQTNDMNGLAQYIAKNGYILAHKVSIQPLNLEKSYDEEFTGYKVDSEYGKYMLKWSLHLKSTYVTDTAGTKILSAENPRAANLAATTTTAGVYIESNGLPTISYFYPVAPRIINNGTEVKFAADIKISATFAGNTDWGPMGKELHFALPRLSGSVTV